MDVCRVLCKYEQDKNLLAKPANADIFSVVVSLPFSFSGERKDFWKYMYILFCVRRLKTCLPQSFLLLEKIFHKVHFYYL